MTKPPPPAPSGKLVEAAITWSEDGIPTSTRHGDVYFDRTDPMGEVRHVFLDGCDLPNAWRGRASHLIVETGFGTGLNFLMAWDLWRRERRAHPEDTPARLEFASVEAAPLDIAALERAHDAFPALTDPAGRLRAHYPPRIPGWHRLEFRDNEADGHVMLLLGFGDAATRLAEMDFRAHSWFLDGFAPGRNPDMWTPALFSRIARLSKRGTPETAARLASFTAAGIVRRGLSDVGFRIEKRPGFGTKRDSIHGIFTPADDADGNDTEPAFLADAPWFARPCPIDDADPVAVIGAGIAGTAVCDALSARGRASLLIARPDDAPAPPIALIGPRLTMGKDAFARFWIDAHLDAVRDFDAREIDDPAQPIWAAPRGLRLDAAANGQDAMRLEAHLDWPEDWLRCAGKDEPEVLHLPKAGAVDGPRLLARYADAAGERTDAEVAALSRIERPDGGGAWSLRSPDGEVVAEATTVVLACGAFTASLLPDNAPSPPFRYDAGHVGLLPSNALEDGWSAQSVLGSGYATAAIDDRFALGATAVRLAAPAIPEIQAETHLTLQSKAEGLGIHLAPDAITNDLDVWSGVRAKLPDHMPVAGGVPDADFHRDAYNDIGDGNRFKPYPAARYLPGLFMLSGLGTRGFQAAPILAAHLASEICGTASPLPRIIRHALHPARFLIRRLKRGK